MISMILAVSKNNIIGYKGNLPWKRISPDMQWFKQHTMNNIIVMGRKTFESLNNIPLKDRINVVVSSHELNNENIEIISSTDNLENKFKELSIKYPNKEIFIIGGAKLYNATKDLVDKFYLTEIHQRYEGDTRFDISFMHDLHIEYSRCLSATEEHPALTFTIYCKSISENTI